MSGRTAARTDWRDEGSFRPEQFAPGTQERRDYDTEAALIVNEYENERVEP